MFHWLAYTLEGELLRGNKGHNNLSWVLFGFELYILKERAITFIPKFVIQSARGKAIVWARKWNMWRYKCQQGEVTVAYCQFWCDTESSANPLSYRDTGVGGDCYLKQFAGSTPFFLQVSFRLIEQNFFLGLVCNNPGASSGKTLENREKRSSPSEAVTTAEFLQNGTRCGSKGWGLKIEMRSGTEESLDQSWWSLRKMCVRHDLR